MITRSVTEAKYFRIKSPAWVAVGHGYSEHIIGHLWYEGPFVSEEDVQDKLAQAMESYKDQHAWTKAPQVEFFWKPLDIISNL